MPRMLVMTDRVIDASSRASYVNEIGGRQNSAASAGANFWVFESMNSAGHFLEFVEAGGEGALSDALAATCTAAPTAARPVWREVTGD